MNDSVQGSVTVDLRLIPVTRTPRSERPLRSPTVIREARRRVTVALRSTVTRLRWISVWLERLLTGCARPSAARRLTLLNDRKIASPGVV